MSILSKNIPSMIYYKPLHLQTVMERLRYKNDFPISKVSKQIFSILMHPYLDKIQQDTIIEILNVKIEMNPL